MKKVVFLISALLTMLSGPYAQNTFKAGVLGGMTATQVDGDNYGGYDKIGVLAGGFVHTDISDKFILQMELSYIQKGSRKYPNPKEGDYTEFLIRLNYVEVPLVLRYRLNQFRIEAGPYYGRLIKSYMEDISGEIPIDPPFKDYDMGGIFGASYYFNDQLAVNWRTKASLLPIRDIEPYISYWFNKGWYNLELNLSLRYLFGGKED